MAMKKTISNSESSSFACLLVSFLFVSLDLCLVVVIVIILFLNRTTTHSSDLAQDIQVGSVV